MSHSLAYFTCSVNTYYLMWLTIHFYDNVNLITRVVIVLIQINVTNIQYGYLMMDSCGKELKIRL